MITMINVICMITMINVITVVNVICMITMICNNYRCRHCEEYLRGTNKDDKAVHETDNAL